MQHFISQLLIPYWNIYSFAHVLWSIRDFRGPTVLPPGLVEGTAVQVCCCNPDLLKFKPRNAVWLVQKSHGRPVTETEGHSPDPVAPEPVHRVQVKGWRTVNSLMRSWEYCHCPNQSPPHLAGHRQKSAACLPSLLLEHWAWQWPCMPRRISANRRHSALLLCPFSLKFQWALRMSLTNTVWPSIHIPRGCFFVILSLPEKAGRVLVWQDEPWGSDWVTFDYQKGLECTSGENSLSTLTRWRAVSGVSLPMNTKWWLTPWHDSMDGHGMASLLSAQNTPVIDLYLCPWISVFTVIHTFICKWNSQVLKEKDHVVVGCCLFVACGCAAEHISLLLRTPQWLSTGAGLKVTSGGCTTTLSQVPGQRCGCPMARVLLPMSPPAWLGISAHPDARQWDLPDPHTAQGYNGGMQPWTPGKCPYLWHCTKWGFFQTDVCFFFQTLRDNQGESKIFPLCLSLSPKE